MFLDSDSKFLEKYNFIKFTEQYYDIAIKLIDRCKDEEYSSLLCRNVDCSDCPFSRLNNSNTNRTSCGTIGTFFEEIDPSVPLNPVSRALSLARLNELVDDLSKISFWRVK